MKQLNPSREIGSKVRALLLPIYEDIENTVSREPNVCTRGCSSCCHQNVGIQAPEGALIEDFINARMTPLQRLNARRRAEAWIDFFNTNTRAVTKNHPLTWEEFQQVENEIAAARIACPFLEGGECDIYPVRPVACRSHVVDSDPTYCSKFVRRDSTVAGRKARQVAMQSIGLSFGKLGHARSLVYAVASALKVKKRLKPYEIR